MCSFHLHAFHLPSFISVYICIPHLFHRFTYLYLCIPSYMWTLHLMHAPFTYYKYASYTRCKP
ncbi:hypothetical protein BYT27DRAFT_6764399 [Phlegmacium glaucopus]|nr:hypothetical protein BYT27DRAFT_6764399 [Phlegmacium glaucopus]